MKNFLVVSLTARRNFDVSQILQQKNQLYKLITDFYYKPNHLWEKFLKRIYPKFFELFKKYRNPKIPDEKVERNILIGYYFRFILKYLQRKHHYKGHRFSTKSLTVIAAKQNQNEFYAVYAYDTCALELFSVFKNKKVLFLEQCVAPRSAQILMYREFEEKYKMNFSNEIQNCSNLFKRERDEWFFATKIICPSTYVFEELIKAGVDQSKIKMVPYGYTNELEVSKIEYAIERRTLRTKLNILFVGNETIRKGVADIVEVARHFEAQKINHIEFHIVGQINQEELIKIDSHLPNNMTFHGKCNRAKVDDLYLEGNLFLLPSYLEGSALVTYEALSFGLPLIVSKETGSVITDGLEGFLVKPGDIEMMVHHILNMDENRKVLLEKSHKALLLSKSYNLEKYQQRLEKILLNE